MFHRYFVVDFEMSRPRWYWFDEKAAAKQLQLRLSYHPLSRQYRLSTGTLQQNFATSPIRKLPPFLGADGYVGFSDWATAWEKFTAGT